MSLYTLNDDMLLGCCLKRKRSNRWLQNVSMLLRQRRKNLNVMGTLRSCGKILGDFYERKSFCGNSFKLS